METHEAYLPLAIVALLILIPVGVVVAAKTAKTGKKAAAAAKATHHTAKQRAANDKLTHELLQIMDETDNKATFAACLECLSQLRPQREVIVPAIIRKADKMGWLRPEATDDWAMIGEYVVKFRLPRRTAPTASSGSRLDCPSDQ